MTNVEANQEKITPDLERSGWHMHMHLHYMINDTTAFLNYNSTYLLEHYPERFQEAQNSLRETTQWLKEGSRTSSELTEREQQIWGACSDMFNAVSRAKGEPEFKGIDLGYLAYCGGMHVIPGTLELNYPTCKRSS